MRKNRIWKKNSLATLVVLLVGPLSILFLAGCHKPDADLGWINRQIYQRPAPLNPYLVLDNPGQFYDSDQFGRPDWPVSPEANKFVTDYEYAVYRNYSVDRQAVAPSGRTLNFTRNQSGSYSWGHYRR